MTRIRKRGEKIRTFILQNVDSHPADIAKIAAKKFEISRQAIHKHLMRLVDEGALLREGNTKNRTYRLHPTETWRGVYNLADNLQEDVVWRTDILPLLSPLADNVVDIWHYGFTEMLNNAIDHSGGTIVAIRVQNTPTNTVITINDDGLGIFKKIKTELGLLDERHAVLELAKGKLTTDPENHTGEGIFFSSRMFNLFNILSGDVFFSHQREQSLDWILERDGAKTTGTQVFMSLNNHTSRTTKKIFDQFTSKDGEYGFTKTIVPVQLAQYGDDKLVSRSQAKRLLARVDRFQTVLFDFQGVDNIGQAFADEIFRVFANKNPGIEVTHVKANSAVKRMILRASSQG